MDSTWCSLTHQGLSFQGTKSPTRGTMVWFGLGDLNVTNKTNNLPS